MKRIVEVRSRSERVPLTRPYTIARGSCDAVDLVFCELVADDGTIGRGQASPAFELTNETADMCAAELEAENLAWLVGREVREFSALFAALPERLRGPEARAAVDMALFDLEAQHAHAPLVEELGRVHAEMATSITIGVMPVAETLAEAREYFERGFRILKVKIGVDVDLDIERLTKLREVFGSTIVLRADGNQGYDGAALARFVPHMSKLDLEMLEQPLHADDDAALMSFPKHVRDRLAADESVHDEHDLKRLVRTGMPFGIINIKLMKAGGIHSALRMTRIAEREGLRVMWGCMDESVLGIAAALHVAFSTRATHYLDLDGSFDLSADPLTGGFELQGDKLRTLKRPGLGVKPT